MWHEARRQEKIVRKVIVDYRKRAERRQEYYEKIKQDPTKFMQVHGRKCKFHIDEGGVASDSNSYMMPWQGDKSNMIDRFDVRAHLDIIRDVKSSTEIDFSTDKVERKCQYERYRILIYNKHRGISQSQHLKQIHINEAYPELTAQKQEAEAKKQMLASSKATIAYTYEGGTSHSGSKTHATANEEDEDDDDDWSDDDFFKELEDVPSVNELNAAALSDLETLSFDYGLYIHDFTNSLKQDQSLQDKMDKAKALENEKAKMSGKKSRRERRLLKDNRLKNRTIGPLSYILHEADESDSGSDSRKSDSSSSSDEERSHHRKSSTGQGGGQIEFITSFGGASNETAAAKSSKLSAHHSKHASHKTTSRRRSRSRSRSRRSRSRSRESGRRYDRGRRSSERDRYHRRSRSRERERHRRSRSRSRHSRSPERSRRSRSRSKGHEKPSYATVKPASAPQTPGDKAKKLTPQERLKIKMQRALKKQLKADREATADKRAKAYQEQVEREEELQKMTRKIRKREDDRIEMDSPIRSYRCAYY